MSADQWACGLDSDTLNGVSVGSAAQWAMKLAQGFNLGFNPGSPHNKRFALKLKGREIRTSPYQACND